MEKRLLFHLDVFLSLLFASAINGRMSLVNSLGIYIFVHTHVHARAYIVVIITLSEFTARESRKRTRSCITYVGVCSGLPMLTGIAREPSRGSATRVR